MALGNLYKNVAVVTGNWKTRKCGNGNGNGNGKGRPKRRSIFLIGLLTTRRSYSRVVAVLARQIDA